MKASTLPGFTIIETLLFLAVTGLLVFAILGGTGFALTQQRYRDSVNSFASLLQEQYADSMATYNDRLTDWTCNDTDGLRQTPTGSGISRGTSDCVLLGKIMRSTDGVNLTSDTIVARNVAATSSMQADSDLASLQALELQTLGSIDAATSERHTLEWGASLRRPSDGHPPAAFSLMIVRSPASGMIRTFIDTRSGTTPLADMITASSLASGASFCVDPGGIVLGGRISVEIQPNSASAGGVRINGIDAAC